MIPISKPCFGREEAEAIQKPLETGWVVQGPFVERFEREFAAFCAAPHAAATSSCTTALHLGVTALGLEAGAEVIVPAFTWIATPNAVEYAGAKPVFCDISLETYNLEPALLPSLVTSRTAGILPVHLFGLCAEMDAVLAVARRRSLWVLEDAACALGARIEGRHAGGFGDAGCFSFHPRKSITTGEGGMVTTARPDLDAAVRSLRDFGSSRPDRARPSFTLASYDRLGFNYRMTDIQGALGCVQISRAAAILAERARLAMRYDERLASVPWLRLPTVPNGYTHGWQSYVCLFVPEAPTLENVEALSAEREALMLELEAAGIATRQGTHAPVLEGYYVKKYGLRREDFPNATIADRLSLALPLYAGLTDAELDFVCDRLLALGPTVRRPD